jgi:hypothetical protein
MKPMRFPRRFPWLIVLLIAVGPVLFSVPLTIWYSFTMPPLERYYYDAYFNSTADGFSSLPSLLIVRRFCRCIPCGLICLSCA